MRRLIRRTLDRALPDPGYPGWIAAGIGLLCADSLFASHIAGTKTFDVEECLRSAGFEAGVKGYAAEIWAWTDDHAPPSARAVREVLIRGHP